MSEAIATFFGFIMGAIVFTYLGNKDIDCYQAVVVKGKSECAVYINKSLMEK